MNWAVLEQLTALNAERRRPALEREDRQLAERYAGQYVAYTDDWDDRHEVVRTVLAATPDRAEFERLRDASGWRAQHWVKAVAVPPAAPLPTPPPGPSAVERMKALMALNAKTPVQVEALKRADYALCDQYPGHDVAFLDTWNGDELVRTILFATADGTEFSRQLNALPPELRWRIGHLQVPEPGVIDCPSVWFE